jgi:hypothetical protein
MAREIRRAGPIPTWGDGKPLRCGVCKEWIWCKRGRQKLDNHIKREHPEVWKRRYVPFYKDRERARRQFAV